MITLIKENLTQYVHRCKVCKSWFVYDIKDYVANCYSANNGYVSCPCCHNKNRIKFKIKYKSSKKINENYKSLYEESLKEQKRLENTNNNFLLDTEKLNNTIKELENKYKHDQEDYEDLFQAFKIADTKLGDVDDYIENYLNSDKKNNLATKYIKEIKEIINKK